MMWHRTVGVGEAGRRRQGFTLIELMMVIALGLILAAIGVGAYQGFQNAGTVEAAVNTLSAGAKLTRSLAVRPVPSMGALTGAGESNYSGTAMLVTPGGRIRLVENDQTMQTKYRVDFYGQTLDTDGPDGDSDPDVWEPQFEPRSLPDWVPVRDENGTPTDESDDSLLAWDGYLPNYIPKNGYIEELRFIRPRGYSAGNNHPCNFWKRPNENPSGYRDIPGLDYIALPRDAGVAGFDRKGALEFSLLLPPFAVVYSAEGTIKSDARNSRQGRPYWVHYDGNYDTKVIVDLNYYEVKSYGCLNNGQYATSPPNPDWPPYATNPDATNDAPAGTPGYTRYRPIPGSTRHRPYYPDPYTAGITWTNPEPGDPGFSDPSQDPFYLDDTQGFVHYDPGLWDPRSPRYGDFDDATSRPGVHPTTKRQKLPFEQIESCAGVFIWSRTAFRDAGHSWEDRGTVAETQAAVKAATDWILANGRAVFFNRYSGQVSK